SHGSVRAKSSAAKSSRLTAAKEAVRLCKRPDDLRARTTRYRARSHEGRTDGVPGQVAHLRRLRHGVHLDRRRAALFRRQEFQERAEAMQVVQGETGIAPSVGRLSRTRASRNDDQ